MILKNTLRLDVSHVFVGKVPFIFIDGAREVWVKLVWFEMECKCDVLAGARTANLLERFVEPRVRYMVRSHTLCGSNFPSHRRVPSFSQVCPVQPVRRVNCVSTVFSFVTTYQGQTVSSVNVIWD